MLPLLARLESDPLHPQDIQLDLVVEGSSCDRHCSSEERKVLGLYACGGLDHLLSVGKIRWDVSTRCLVQCGSENCCVASGLPNDCTVSIALRNASFPWMPTFIYLPTLPLFLKGTSPLQLCGWQLALALLHIHPASNVAFLSFCSPFPNSPSMPWFLQTSPQDVLLSPVGYCFMLIVLPLTCKGMNPRKMAWGFSLRPLNS